MEAWNWYPLSYEGPPVSEMTLWAREDWARCFSLLLNVLSKVCLALFHFHLLIGVAGERVEGSSALQLCGAAATPAVHLPHSCGWRARSRACPGGQSLVR